MPRWLKVVYAYKLDLNDFGPLGFLWTVMKFGSLVEISYICATGAFVLTISPGKITHRRIEMGNL